MTAAIFVMPIRDGRADEFRAFVAELMTNRRVEWAQAQRRWGVTRQVISMQQDHGLAVSYVEGPRPQDAFAAPAASDDPFDRWFTGRVQDLVASTAAVETLADTAPRPGPWRGWRKPR